MNGLDDIEDLILRAAKTHFAPTSIESVSVRTSTGPDEEQVLDVSIRHNNSGPLSPDKTLGFRVLVRNLLLDRGENRLPVHEFVPEEAIMDAPDRAA